MSQKSFIEQKTQQWGNPQVIIERLGNRVKDLIFDRRLVNIPSLSPQHTRRFFESTSGPIIRMMEVLERDDTNKITEFRNEFATLIATYVKDNALQQHFLITRATKVS